MQNFIAQYPGVLSARSCREVVRRFESCRQGNPGRAGTVIDPALKASVDVSLDNDGWSDVKATLERAMLRGACCYVRDVPHALIGAVSIFALGRGSEARRITEGDVIGSDDRTLAGLVARVFRPGSITIQKYARGHGGYHIWHSERYPMQGSVEPLHRVLFMILYLNDVLIGGETEFLYQGMKIPPRAGTLLVAPAGFTHTHRGNVPTDTEKYVAASWILYRPAEQLAGVLPDVAAPDGV